MNDYLYDTNFLKKIDEYPNKIIYIKITSLDLNEQLIDQLEGKVVSGNLNIDGTSSVRRSCSFSFYVKEQKELNDYYWGLKTKVAIEIGISNFIDQKYPDVLWFHQGIFVITSFSSSLSSSGMTVNISAKDKMCLLNGELGGVINAPVDFGTLEELFENIEFKKLKIKTILPYLVHSFGGESYPNIIINDIEDTALQIVEYSGPEGQMYLLQRVEDANQWKVIPRGTQITWNGTTKEVEKIYNDDNFLPCRMVDITDQNKEGFSVIIFEQENYYIHCAEPGEAVGYQYTDLVFPGELTCKAGDSVVSVLDRIKEILGSDYEYFYNTKGQFIFQKGEQYIQTNWQPLTFYLDGVTVVAKNSNSPIKYNFDDLKLITSINNAPNLQEVKNDFTCWGQNNNNDPIHMRLAVDKKPWAYRSVNITLDDINNWNNNHPEEPMAGSLAQISTLYDSRPSNTSYSIYTEIETQEPQQLKSNVSITGPDSYAGNGAITTYKIGEADALISIINMLKTRNCILIKELSNEEGQSALYYIVAEDPIVYWGISYDKFSGSSDTPKVPFRIKEKKIDNPVSLTLNSYSLYSESEDFKIGSQTFKKVKLDLAIESQNYLDTKYFIDGKLIELQNWEIEFDTSEITADNIHDKDAFNRLEPFMKMYVDKSWASNCPLFSLWYKDKTTSSFIKYKDPILDVQNVVRDIVGVGSNKHTYNRIYLSFPVSSLEFFVYFLDKQYQLAVNKVKFISVQDELQEIDFLDWRELIYQMAKDNYYFGHFDNFNNKLIEANKSLNLYQNGATGYEQYYIDILSFWRDIYSYSINDYQELSRKDALLEVRQKNVVYYEGYEEINPQRIGQYNLSSLIIQQKSTGKYYDFFSYVDPIREASVSNPIAYVYIMINGEYENVPFSNYGYNYKKNNFYKLYASNTKIEKNKTSFYSLALKQCTNAYKDGEITIWAKTNMKQRIKTVAEFPEVSTINLITYTNLVGRQKEQRHDDNRFYEGLSSSPLTVTPTDLHEFYSNSHWDHELLANPSKIKFWLDFIDTQGDIAAYSNKAIGNRQKVINNNNAKSLWYLDVPNIIYGSPSLTMGGKYCFIEIPEDDSKWDTINSSLILSTQSLNAKQLIETDLNNYAYLKNNISITCVPIYYLQPNTIFTLYDKDTKSYKKYLINRISYNLAYDGLMTISASEIIERIY